MRRRLALALGSLAAVVLAAWFGLGWRRDAGMVRGIDVSHHQGPIDWRALADQGIAFAYIKASEGASHVDPRFEVNWRRAGQAGVARGAYHFFTLCRSGLQQAEHFIKTAPREPGALAPAVDLEHMGPCRKGPTMTDVARQADDFLDRAELHYGVRPIIYTTREFHDAHLAGLRGERFWLRSLHRRPGFRRDAWLIWQHDNRGRLRGVAGPIDLNRFRGDAAAFAASSHLWIQEPLAP